jgi:transcriptional regulator with XRE-family HTH domain
MNTIGRRITQLRKEQGMTQEELAQKLDVTSQAVSKWENDVSCPDILILPQLADILHTTTDYLLSGKKDEVRCIPADKRKDFNDLTLRVKILSTKGDKIQVNLPVPLLRAFLDAGMDIGAEMSGMEALKKLDMKQIMLLIENGTVGKLVEMESADGDTVEIVVE